MTLSSSIPTLGHWVVVPRPWDMRQEGDHDSLAEITSEASSVRPFSILMPSDEGERMRRRERISSASTRSVSICESPTVLGEVQSLPTARTVLKELASQTERREVDKVKVKGAGRRLVCYEVPGAGYKIVYVLYAFDISVGGVDVHSFEQRYSMMRLAANDSGNMASFPPRQILRDMTHDEANVSNRQIALAKWLEIVMSNPKRTEKALNSRAFQACLGLY